MKKLLTLILVLCSVVGFAQIRGGAQYDPGAARSNLTNITSGSALGVANGGTGKTTAAEALAALGGASLNGSSTVAFNASTINGVAPLTSAEKTQALVGSSTVNHATANETTTGTRTWTRTYGAYTVGHIDYSYTPGVQAGSAIATLSEAIGPYFVGHVYVSDLGVAGYAAGTAIYYIANGATALVGGNAQFTATKDNAATINIYTVATATGIGLVCQNNKAVPARVFIRVIGATAQ